MYKIVHRFFCAAGQLICLSLFVLFCVGLFGSLFVLLVFVYLFLFWFVSLFRSPRLRGRGIVKGGGGGLLLKGRGGGLLLKGGGVC